MELDARRLERGTLLDADVCIIGAGPAGITVAGELASQVHSVVLLESGGTQDDQEIQQLNHGRVIGSPYQGLRQTRHRQVGGSAHLWNTPIERVPGAKYVPLDPLDFELRPDVPLSGWPFGFRDLEPFYRRAQSVCGLGPFDYGGHHWEDPARPLLPGSEDDLTTRVYQCGVAQRFTQTLAAQLRASPNVRVLYYATCCAVHSDNAGRVVEAEVKSAAKHTLRIRSRAFVLAAGAVENARLLLASSGNQTTLGNHGAWVGRCFMEHPRDYALRVIPDSRDVFQRIAFYDLHRSRDSSWVIGRLALGSSARQSQRFPNASVSLLPRPRRRPWLEAIGPRLGRVGTLIERRTAVGYGWSASRNVRRRLDSIQVLLNVEQFPQEENRIVLTEERDENGVPKAELHWRWRDEEQATLGRLRMFVAARLNQMGLGRIEVTHGMRPDPNAHHHAGTTKLSVDPHRGVADPDCRVHGTENLYLAGASLFPTVGFANPTLTVVALAIRLADHLKARLHNLPGAMISR